ncbi:Thymidylate kinase [Corynebacterium kalinowskii]|uniref:Thymidylate kinase n=1 Tax=Corynebacterium kalinowskii TaxID=2675216 RepID=A0A6B8W616_9CORY|nr:dTMP kinase [Corynebacterium kalinowskii]QGU02688.1 Thymidylate kinase [Corynebacterium kalinowskii]
MIISIEGIDGAGKNTLARALTERISADRLAFPRYEESIHAQLAARALRLEMGDLTNSAYAMATLFALDRHGVVEKLRAASGRDEILLLDRYVASNAAYSWARTEDESVVQWVFDLEFGDLGLPQPDLQVLLDTPVKVAAERAEKRAEADASRAKDAYETDGGLQARTCEAYRRLAATSWAGQWIVAQPNEDVSSLAERIITRIQAQKNL